MTHHRQQGFSLIELMVTLAVLAIIIAIAVPSFKTMILNQRVKSASFDIVASLAYARGEAVKQNGNITITPTGGNWSNGWTMSGSGGVFKTQSAFANVTITGPATIVFGRSGRVTAGTGNIQIDDSESSSAIVPRCIAIGVTGQPKSKTGACT
ncbi:MAG: GspH/FimT family pseudopilin [Rhodocyclaceae bacterium]|nr:GspH/FimT family pseudopilin [Rhodocyclaceae bacterium]MDZ4214691.1 GspH/FimT family pseudopilin [Rhodocyclaceae bacterium]